MAGLGRFQHDRDAIVGWVEHSETHRTKLPCAKVIGFAMLNPSYIRYIRGMWGIRRPPTRTGSIWRARPVASSTATKTPHSVASPSAGLAFSPGILVTK